MLKYPMHALVIVPLSPNPSFETKMLSPKIFIPAKSNFSILYPKTESCDDVIH